MFNLNLIELPEVSRIDGELRYYQTPTGEKYPSVTTVLKNTKVEDGGLERWRNRIGHAEAEKITQRSATRGTSVHSLCEQFALNKELDTRREMPANLMLFKQIKPLLQEHVDNIKACEGYLFSHRLKVAGAVDLIANWNNLPAIIDFKTSRTHKREEWIEDYKIQATLYSLMLYEMTRYFHNKIVIIIACEEEFQPQVIETTAVEWMDRAIDRCEQFHKNS